MSPSAYDWVVRFAEELGTTAPDHAEFNALLGLSSIAAHSSERKAAPVACFVAGRAGVSTAEAIVVARRIAGEASDEQSSAEGDEEPGEPTPAEQ